MMLYQIGRESICLLPINMYYIIVSTVARNCSVTDTAEPELFYRLEFYTIHRLVFGYGAGVNSQLK